MRRPAVPVAVGLIALIVASVAFAGTARTQVDTINVSGNASYTGVGMQLALEKGFFEKRGLDVKYTTLSPAARFAALVGGSNQIIDCPTVNMLQGIESGFKFTIVAPQAGTRRNLGGVMVKADSSIRRPKDLEGKTIAVASTRGTQEMSDREMLRRLKVDVSRVTFLAVPITGTLSALAQGRVDAADLTQPFFSEAKASKQYRTIFDANLGYGPYGSLNSFYCTTPQYAQQNPAIVRNFTAAIVEANKYAATHPREAKLALKRTNPALTDAQLLATSIGTYPAAFTRTQLQYLFDTALRAGLVKERHLVADVLWSGAPIAKPVKKK